MTVEFMEGFETALTGNDYSARGVLRLASFEILAQPQGRNGGHALGRVGDCGAANTVPRSSTTSADPYVIQFDNRTINQIWTGGGCLLSLWSQYKTVFPATGFSPKPGGGIYFGTSVVTAQTDTSFAVSRENPTTPGSVAGLWRFNYSEGVFMACDGNGNSGQLFIRLDGTDTIIQSAPLGIFNCQSVDFHSGLYVAAGRGATSGSAQYVATSTDAVNWTPRGPSGSINNTSNSVRWLNGPNVWISCGVGHLMRSTDGINWTQPTNPAGSAVLYDVNTDGTNIVIVGANIVMQSTDSGVTWTLRTNPISGVTWSSIGASTTRFVIGNSADGRTAYSTDGGLSWTVGGTGLTATGQFSIAYDGAVFLKGSTGTMEASVDGVTWSVVMRYVDTLNAVASSGSNNNGAYWLFVGTAQANGTITTTSNPFYGLVWDNTNWYYFNTNSGPANSTVPVSAKNTWFNVKFLLVPTTTTNQFTWTLTVDDTPIFSGPITLDGTKNLFFGLPNTGINFHDDFVVTNFTAPNAGDLGDVSIIGKLPSSDIQAQLVRNPTGGSNASAVNAGSLSQNLTLGTSVQSDASGQQDIYAGTLHGSLSGRRVAALQTEAHFARLLSTSPQVNVGVDVGGTVVTGANVTLSNTVGTPAAVITVFNTAPGSVPWGNTSATDSGIVISRV